MAEKYQLPDGTTIDMSSPDALQKSLETVDPAIRDMVKKRVLRSLTKKRIQERVAQTGGAVKDVAKQARDSVASSVGAAARTAGGLASAGVGAVREATGPVLREGVELGKELGGEALDLGLEGAKTVGKGAWTVATNPIDVTRQIASSATFGLAPMAEAFLRSGVQQKSMDRILSEIRQSNREFYREHPIIATTAGLATPLRAVPHVAWALPWREINRLQRMKLWPSQRFQSRFTDPVEKGVPLFKMVDAFAPPRGRPAVTVPTALEAEREALRPPMFEVKGEAPLQSIQPKVNPDGSLSIETKEGVAPVSAIVPEILGAEKTSPEGAPQGGYAEWSPAQWNARFQQGKSGLRQLLQGATFDFGDEAEAMIRSLAGGGTYPEIVSDIRTQNEAFREENPMGALALQILGGLGTGTGTARAATKLLPAAKQGSQLLRALRWPAGGAGAGAATGAGATDPDSIKIGESDREFTPSGNMIDAMRGELAVLESRNPDALSNEERVRLEGRKRALKEEITARQDTLAGGESQSRLGPALRGGTLGGVTGTVIPFVGKGVSYVTKDYVDGILSQLGRSADKTAALKIQRALNKDELTPQQALAKIDELGPGAILGDVGPHTRGLTQKALEQAPTDVRRAATTHLSARPLDVQLGKKVSSLRGESPPTDVIDDAVAGTVPVKVTDDLTAATQEMAEKMPARVQELIEEFGVDSPQVQAIAMKAQAITPKIQAMPDEIAAIMKGANTPSQVKQMLEGIASYGDDVVEELRQVSPSAADIMLDATQMLKKKAVTEGLHTLLQSDPNAAQFILTHSAALTKARGAEFSKPFLNELNNFVELSASGRGILSGAGKTSGGAAGGWQPGGIADTAETLFFLESVGGPKVLAGEIARATADKASRISPAARAALAKLLSEPGQGQKLIDTLNSIGNFHLRTGANLTGGAQLGRAQAR